MPKSCERVGKKIRNIMKTEKISSKKFEKIEKTKMEKLTGGIQTLWCVSRTQSRIRFLDDEGNHLYYGEYVARADEGDINNGDPAF